MATCPHRTLEMPIQCEEPLLLSRRRRLEMRALKR